MLREISIGTDKSMQFLWKGIVPRLLQSLRQLQTLLLLRLLFAGVQVRRMSFVFSSVYLLLFFPSLASPLSFYCYLLPSYPSVLLPATLLSLCSSSVSALLSLRSAPPFFLLCFFLHFVAFISIATRLFILWLSLLHSPFVREGGEETVCLTCQSSDMMWNPIKSFVPHWIADFIFIIASALNLSAFPCPASCSFPIDWFIELALFRAQPNFLL